MEQDTQTNSKSHNEYITPGAVVLAGFMISASILYAGGVAAPAQGLLADAQGQNTETSENPSSQQLLEVTDNDHVRGNPNAPITIIEYSDFECPFCARFHPTMQQVLAEYGDQVRWVYRHFPLTQIHPDAFPSAEASECVAEQKGNEGFWQFADAMFAAQAIGLDVGLYRQVAEQIGVDIAQYDDCVSSQKYADKVAADQTGGVTLGVNGTPGSFVNGTPVRGALPYNENSPDYQAGFPTLQSIIDAEIQKL